ncbi:MAG TPA: amino acid permease [Polyangia bacterium]|nr:amino acid permease [Polyangia bacterium]
MAELAPGKLHRALSRWDGIAVAVGSVVGVGIFRVTGEVFRGAGSAGRALAVWAVLGALALVGSFVYADLATRVPEAGGPYAYVREGFGRFAAFLDGWITVGAGNPALQAAGVAFIVEKLIEMTGVAAPRLLAVAVVAGFLVFNWLGVRVGAGAQKMFTLFKLIALAGLIVLALWPLRGPMPPVPPLAALPLIAALNGAWYAYVGWQDGSLLAEELREPRRDLPFVLVGAVATVVAVYLCVNAAIIYAAHGTGLAATDQPALGIAERVLGARAGRLMSAVILVSMIGGTAEGFLVHPRLGFALGRDGLAPRALAWVNGSGTPALALSLHSVIIAALVLTNRFADILSLLVFTQALQAVLESSSYFVVRRRITGAQLTPLHPVLPAAFVGANAALAVWVAVSDPWHTLYGILVVAGASVAYLVWRLLQ